MTHRVGIDLVTVEAVEQAIRDHGRRYLARVYSAGEVADAGSVDAPDASRLAARFAAKEATLKVLRAHELAIPLSSIEVVRTDWGGVEIQLSGAAADRAAEEHLTSFALSLTHEAGYAAAVVLAEEANVDR